jgi:cell division protein YceG involved in septum cleavage
MKTLLTTKGYVIQTKAEYDKSLQDAKGAGQKEAAPDGNQPQKTATKVVVNVTEGMTSIDVGRMLVGANIVQDAFGFSKDIENRGLQNKLHPGTFVVDSDMPIDQVISTIFK